MREQRLPVRRFVPGWIPLLLTILLAVVGLVLMNGQVREARRERDATLVRLRAAQKRIGRLLFEAEGLQGNISSLREREKQLQQGVSACQAAADKSVEVQRLAVQMVDTLTLAVLAVQAGNIADANQQLDRARSDSDQMNAGVDEANRRLGECRSVLVFTDDG
jgi:DNA repair exonuclease SbcCD ATPase subunit